MEGDVEGVMERPSGSAAAGSESADSADENRKVTTGTEASRNGAGDGERKERDRGLSREEAAELSKWEAWSACAGLSRTQAKMRYIEVLIATMHAYAYSSAEAKALVDELEFVWESVRGNTASGAAAAAAEAREGGVGKRDGLRVLRPMSEVDSDREYARGGVGDGGGEEWQIRIDRALVQITAEIAALREVVEARSRYVSYGTIMGRMGWLNWMLHGLGTMLRRVLVDGIVVAFVWGFVRWWEQRRILALWNWFREIVRRRMRRRDR